LNQKGEEVSQTVLPKEIFQVQMNLDLVHQVMTSQVANQRRSIAKVKDRQEARGGVGKPWQQKGTGRARHGSIRSPIWKGGGVTFGPRAEKNYERRITKKMRRKALFMVLSAKAKGSLLLILEDLAVQSPKTKAMVQILGKLFLGKGSGLVVIPKYDINIIKSVRNIKRAKIMEAKNLNVLDLMSSKYLVMPKEAIKAIKETFTDKKTEEVKK
jgi:large subunit ribosomal protein L4